MGLLGSLEHAYGQFGFSLKAEEVWDVGGLASREISAPVFGQVQFAIDEAMALLGDVGEENTNLTVLDGSAHAAILDGDASGVATAFGQGALINSQNGKDRRGGR